MINYVSKNFLNLVLLQLLFTVLYSYSIKKCTFDNKNPSLYRKKFISNSYHCLDFIVNEYVYKYFKCVWTYLSTYSLTYFLCSFFYFMLIASLSLELAITMIFRIRAVIATIFFLPLPIRSE